MLNNVSVMEDRTAVHVFSTMNEWMDCVFIVRNEDVEKAACVLDKAFGDWFDDPDAHFVPYGNWLCSAMDAAGFEYDVFFHDSGEEESE